MWRRLPHNLPFFWFLDDFAGKVLLGSVHEEVSPKEETPDKPFLSASLLPSYDNETKEKENYWIFFDFHY
jgi:hypothetical protein